MRTTQSLVAGGELAMGPSTVCPGAARGLVKNFTTGICAY